MTKSHLLSQLVLNLIRNIDASGIPAVYLSLHTADPGITGASEVVAAEYNRKPITFGVPVDDYTLNDVLVIYDIAQSLWGDISHAGLWDAPAAGNFLIGGAFIAPTNIDVNKVPVVQVGTLTHQET